MARRPVALDSATGPLAAFAQELRSLRDRRGSSAPSVDEVSRREHIPRSTLYAALRGERLPSRRVISALARSWGGAEGSGSPSAARSSRPSRVALPMLIAINIGNVLVRLGLDGYQLIEQLVDDLMRSGCRPREAWRLARELTQDEVATRFNQVRGDPNVRMRGSRISEYEKWPMGGVRPSVRTLKILAAIYETTWDRLVDVDDLEGMPTGDRQAFLDSRERLVVPSPQSPSEGSGGGLPGEVTHFTGRDGPMAELRALAEQAPRGPVVTIYAIDGMAGVGKTAFARHAAQEFAARYPDGAIWVDLYGHTPGMQPREPSGALEQMLLQLGVRPEAIKADLAERQHQWRHHIHARRMLIVLDNVRTSDQALALLPEAPECLVLITSRRKLTGLTDAYPLSLDVLGWDEASGCSSSWWASNDAKTATLFARSWVRVAVATGDQAHCRAVTSPQG